MLKERFLGGKPVLFNSVFIAFFRVGLFCGSNAFQDYFGDAKDSSLESRVKKVPRIKKPFNQSKFQESKSRSIKTQDSSKESREDLIKISIKRVFQNIE